MDLIGFIIVTLALIFGFGLPPGPVIAIIFGIFLIYLTLIWNRL